MRNIQLSGKGAYLGGELWVKGQNSSYREVNAFRSFVDDEGIQRFEAHRNPNSMIMNPIMDAKANTLYFNAGDCTETYERDGRTIYTAPEIVIGKKWQAAIRHSPAPIAEQRKDSSRERMETDILISSVTSPLTFQSSLGKISIPQKNTREIYTLCLFLMGSATQGTDIKTRNRVITLNCRKH